MVSFGDEIAITIDGVNYSTSIEKTTETGGDRQYTILKMNNNNYKRIETGRSNYEVSFMFKMESTTLNTLYEITSSIPVVITGDDFTITYYNMFPSALILNQEIEGIATGELKYMAPAYDKDNTRYNRVIS